MDPDVQPVERSVMGNRADLFQQSEEVAGECEGQLLAVGSCLEGQCCGMSANGIFHRRFALPLNDSGAEPSLTALGVLSG